IYVLEGCNTCHSQMVRPFRDEVARYGEYSRPGEFIYDRPFQWGSKRTGPDLHRVGGKFSSTWHLRHLEDPRVTSPGSLMPSYAAMLRDELDLSDTQRKIRVQRMLGTPYTDEEEAGAVELARAQAAEVAAELERDGAPGLADREVVALIAYLQRLGTDIKKGGAQ